MLFFQQGRRLYSELILKSSLTAGLAAVALMFSACGKPPASSPGPNHALFFPASAQPAITITDSSGTPIAGARILIGSRQNVPFPGNLLVTEANGQINIPSEWTDAQPVTIEASGYVRATFFGRKPGEQTFSLHRAIPPARMELKGETSGFGPLPKDGFLDIGLVFPAMTRQQIGLLQVQALISPENDTMSVFGQKVDVPSNVTFPYQKEDYFFTLTFDKPTYRLYFNEARSWRMVAAHARFPLREVANSLQDGKPFIEIVNKFEFLSASIKDVSIKSGSTAFNLPVNELVFAPAAQVVAPNFDSKHSMLVVSLASDGTLFFPSDVKRLMPREKRTLAMPKGATTGTIVSALRKTDAPDTGAASDEISVVVMPGNQSQAFDFLPIAGTPEPRSGTLITRPPSTVNGIEPAVTYALLSKVDTVQTSTMTLENKTAQWELYAEKWASDLPLPEMPSLIQPKAKYRWEVMFGGQLPGTGALNAGPEALEKVSHVTRSAVDL